MHEQFYVKGLQTGDERIFRGIFERFHTRLCYFANSLLNGEKGAEDVVQDAFVKLWQRKEDFDNLPSVKAFLYLTVKNACYNIYKHEKIVYNHQHAFMGLHRDGAADDPDVMRRMIEAEALEKIYQALQKLPAGCRKVLNLSYFEGMKNEEVARHLHVSINTVKTQKVRGLRLLRQLLSKTSPGVILWLFSKFF